jgi:hypothetical protein
LFSSQGRSCALAAARLGALSGLVSERLYGSLKPTSGRIVAGLRGIHRVTYVRSSKPPATIEWDKPKDRGRETGMRLIFGVMSLLVVLAIVGTLGKKQLEALGLAGQTGTRAAAQGADVKAVSEAVMGRARDGGANTAPPGAVAAPADGSVAAQSRSIQSNVRDAVNAAVQQGANRAAQQPPQ